MYQNYEFKSKQRATAEATRNIVTLPPILCYAWSQQSTKEEKKEHSIFFHPKLALQALCLPLPRFCADITSHPRGCISDATTRVMRMPKPVWMKTGPAQNQMRERSRRGERLEDCEDGNWVVSKEGLRQGELVNVW